MKTLKRLSAVGALLLAVMCSLAPLPCHAQDNTGKRRVVESVTPAYPMLARTLALAGIVKVDVLVAPDGSVKTMEVKAGHPILVQAAANAVRRWRWEPAAHDSHELVEVKFSPE